MLLNYIVLPPSKPNLTFLYRSATLKVVAQHRDSSVKLSYIINGVAQDANIKTFSADSATKPISISVKGSDGKKVSGVCCNGLFFKKYFATNKICGVYFFSD